MSKTKKAAKYCALFGIGFFMVGLMLILAPLSAGKATTPLPGIFFMALSLMCYAEYIYRINLAIKEELCEYLDRRLNSL